MDRLKFNNNERKLIDKYFKGTQKEASHPQCLLKLEGTFNVTPLPQNPIPKLKEGKIDLLIIFPFGYPEYRPPITCIKDEALRLFPHVQVDSGEICPIEPAAWFQNNTLEVFLDYINRFLSDGMVNKLEKADDFYTLPDFPSPFQAGSNYYLVYKIEEPSIWLKKDRGECGIFTFHVLGSMLKVDRFNLNDNQMNLRDRKGIYIWLPEEPTITHKVSPIRFSDLEKVFQKHKISLIDIFNTVYKNRIRSKSALMMLGFPIKVRNCDSPSDIHWQGFLMDFSTFRKSVRDLKKSGKTARWYRDSLEKFNGDLSKRRILYVHSRDCSSKNLYSRVGGQVKVRNCLIFGCGAIGSNLAFELVRAGCENLGLLDVEWLESGNVCRHVLDFKSLKKSKAIELKKKLQHYSPWGRVEAYNCDVFSLRNKSNELKALLDYELWIDAGLPAGPSAYVSSFAHTYKKRYISTFISDKAHYLIILISGLSNEPSMSALQEKLDTILVDKKLHECREVFYNPKNDTRIRPHTGCHFLTFEATGAEMSMVSAILYSVLNDLTHKNYPQGRMMVYKKHVESFSFELILDEKNGK